MSSRELILKLKGQMQKSIIGQENVVERLILALLANGNVLMEGLPGLAKTRAIKTMAKTASPRVAMAPRASTRRGR